MRDGERGEFTVVIVADLREEPLFGAQVRVKQPREAAQRIMRPARLRVPHRGDGAQRIGSGWDQGMILQQLNEGLHGPVSGFRGHAGWICIP